MPLMGGLHVVTGATGLLGSHVAEQLRQRGERVRALVRGSSDTTFLRSLGVELVEGDLENAAALPRAVDGADVVYHCAARVGDWGSWPLFQRAVIEATGNLLVASQAAEVGRFLHVSSINVYGHLPPRAGRIAEDEPLGQNLWLWDYYCRAKIEAEGLVRAYPRPWTIVRPSWMYGPRDRNSLPRVVTAIRRGRARVVGDGSNRLNIVYAPDVADGVLRAAAQPGAVGRAYNLSSEGDVTQREFLDALTKQLGLPRVVRRVSYPQAFAFGLFVEALGRVLRWDRPPPITRYAVALIGRTTSFSIERARQELGWSPRTHPLEGLRETLEWFRPLLGRAR
jgi:nucleoside-diphosphate-sugar epimerase